MIFLSLMFIVLYLLFLVKGGNSIFNKMGIQIAEFNMQKATDENSISEDDKAKIGMKIIFTCIFGIVLAIFEIVFLIKAIKIDLYLYPTLFVIFFVILNILTAKSNKEYDLTTEEGRYEQRKDVEKLKHRTFKGIITQLIYLSYYSYIFYILVFLNR